MHIDFFSMLMASAENVSDCPNGHAADVIDKAEHLIKVRWKCSPVYDGNTVHVGPRLAVAIAEFCEAMSACWASRLLAAKEVVCLSRTAKLAH